MCVYVYVCVRICYCLCVCVMNIQREILNDAARSMARDIGWEILMIAGGWHEYKLELSEGTVYGTGYLTVHPSHGDQWNEMIKWTVDTFGAAAADDLYPKADQRWYVRNARFWFRDSRDLTLFILRWS
jgi:hypothetical protein